MRKTIFAVVFLLIFLVACQQNNQAVAPPAAPTPDVAPAPAPEPTPAPAGEGAAPVVTGTDKVFGQVNKSTALDIDSVSCDKATQTISFRFKNNDDQNKSWSMDETVGWSAPKDMVNVHVFVNDYEANSPNPYILDGKTYFGPNHPFSKNCGGVEVLKPGDDVTCTLSPVPIKSGNQLVNGNNEIFIDTPPSSRHIIQFTCT